MTNEFKEDEDRIHSPKPIWGKGAYTLALDQAEGYTPLEAAKQLPGVSSPIVIPFEILIPKLSQIFRFNSNFSKVSSATPIFLIHEYPF